METKKIPYFVFTTCLYDQDPGYITIISTYWTMAFYVGLLTDTLKKESAKGTINFMRNCRLQKSFRLNIVLDPMIHCHLPPKSRQD